MVTRAHTMPFGAEPLADGSVRFRLWAPAARTVALAVAGNTGDGPAARPVGYSEMSMANEDDGWFSLTTRGATVGSRYAFRIDDRVIVPDPASRFQPDDVHGPSEVIDPGAWSWRDADWPGRPWRDAVIYELHVGTFTAQGDFNGVRDKLAYLADLGVTALELMPVADFPGRRNWGYDGVYPFAPDSRYGRPEQLKALIDAAHGHGLMVLLDVVYNHFGPEGNYLHLYAPQFFTDRHHTPWGAAINYDGEQSDWVRRFFIHNALYWLEEYHLDGLRLDAAHAIIDDSDCHVLNDIAQHVHDRFRDVRQVHLIVENDDNATRYLSRDAAGRPRHYTAQWNDDLHHALHVLLTAQTTGYYTDYAPDPLRHLGRCLSDGFSYQGETSIYRGRPRGEPSGDLPPDAFLAFLQNHDQIGNRACGERIASLTGTEALTAAVAIVLLLPSPPLLFMGEEWSSTRPFLYFCDFDGDLAARVTAGRRDEFATFPEFSDARARARIPDPAHVSSFVRSMLDWDSLRAAPHQHWRALYRELLALRARVLRPRLGAAGDRARVCSRLGERTLAARWDLGDHGHWLLLTNLSGTAQPGVVLPASTPVYTTHPTLDATATALPPWFTCWYLIAAEETP